MLPTPGFHHLHLNSADPDAAIDWYTRQFPSTARADWCGYPALKSPNNVLLLFDKVDAPLAVFDLGHPTVGNAEFRCQISLGKP